MVTIYTETGDAVWRAGFGNGMGRKGKLLGFDCQRTEPVVCVWVTALIHELSFSVTSPLAPLQALH